MSILRQDRRSKGRNRTRNVVVLQTHISSCVFFCAKYGCFRCNSPIIVRNIQQLRKNRRRMLPKFLIDLWTCNTVLIVSGRGITGTLSSGTDGDLQQFYTIIISVNEKTWHKVTYTIIFVATFRHKKI